VGGEGTTFDSFCNRASVAPLTDPFAEVFNMRSAVFALLLLCTCASAEDAIDEKALKGLSNMSYHAPDRVASGRIGAEDIETLKRAGIRVVIDLSDDEETPDFDESAAVTAAGMSYQNLPIDGVAGLTAEHVEQFDQMLAAAGNQPTLVHCGSGNRVGALMALRAATLQGQTLEAAIETGKSWGLKGLEPAVREQLAKREGATPSTAQVERPPLKFPRIALAGGVYALTGDISMPSADREHRLVIDVSDGESNDSGINRRFEAAARAVNLHALAGVPADKLGIALVIHGKATSTVLSDASFQTQFGKPNPNTALMSELHKAGVEFFVCGQAMTHAGYSAAELRDDVQVALSAMTALEDLQTAGYSLIP
jgi:uncharacterized protein (TIGR01244 family)